MTDKRKTTSTNPVPFCCCGCRRRVSSPQGSAWSLTQFSPSSSSSSSRSTSAFASSPERALWPATLQPPTDTAAHSAPSSLCSWHLKEHKGTKGVAHSLSQACACFLLLLRYLLSHYQERNDSDYYENFWKGWILELTDHLLLSLQMISRMLGKEDAM